MQYVTFTPWLPQSKLKGECPTKHSSLHYWTQYLVQLKQCDKDFSTHTCGPMMD